MADEHVYGFNYADAQTLANSVGDGPKEIMLQFRPPVNGDDDRIKHFKSKGGGIPAISGSTMGSATCDEYTSSTGGVLSDSGVDVTIYNTAAAFAANKFGIAAKNSVGLWVAIVEQC